MGELTHGSLGYFYKELEKQEQRVRKAREHSRVRRVAIE
jgi:hypothetical protein